MSEQQADEATEEPTETAAPDSSEESSGSGDTGSSDSGSSDSDSGEPGGVSDAELPEDLQATEDNPLARHPRQTGDEDDKIGADSETGDAANPSASMTYGADDDSGESSGNTSSDDDNEND
jgi:hypothetical protein